MKTGFSSAFIDRLNRAYNAGVWLKAAVVSYQGGTDYWVHYGESLTFNGNVYRPLPMQWEGLDASATMALPAIRVSVSNIQGIAEEYVDTVELLGKDVRLQILHLDLLGTPTDVDEVAVQVQSIEINNLAVSILCGLNMGLNDSLPKDVITRAEFPGNSDDIRRYTII